MGISEYDPGAADVRPWNAGRKVGAKRAFKPKRLCQNTGVTVDDRVRMRFRAVARPDLKDNMWDPTARARHSRAGLRYVAARGYAMEVI